MFWVAFSGFAAFMVLASVVKLNTRAHRACYYIAIACILAQFLAAYMQETGR